MRVSRADFEFCALMVLGVVLFGAAFLIWAQPRLPPYARIDAIEKRFAPQIERLREIALVDTRLVTATRARERRSGLSGRDPSATMPSS